MNPGISRHRAAWTLALLAVVLMVLSVAGCGTADLRTDRLKETGLTPAAIERGKQIRISKAPLVAYAGEASLQGQRYDLVFVTWNQAEPDETADQYVLWINQETRLIDYAQYTVRDQANWAAGTNHFSEYREVEGIMIPHRQTIISEPGGDDVLHEMVVEQVRFDTILPEELLPDAGLTEVGDRKPEPTQ